MHNINTGIEVHMVDKQWQEFNVGMILIHIGLSRHMTVFHHQEGLEAEYWGPWYRML